MKITTHISFTPKGYERVWHHDTRELQFEGSIPNVVIGQIFVYDHPSMDECKTGRVRNIQHAIDLDKNVTQYIDVEI